MIISASQLDAIKELINIGIGKGANMLNTIINSHIRLSCPYVEVIKSEILEVKLDILSAERISVVNLPYNGELNGAAKLIIPSESASKLVTAFTGEAIDILELDAIRAGTLSEIGNIVLNSVVGAIGNLLHIHLNYKVPSFREGSVKSILYNSSKNKDNIVIYAKTTFLVEELEIVGDLALFLEVNSYENLLKLIDSFCTDYGVSLD